MASQDSVEKHLGLFRAKCALQRKEHKVEELLHGQTEMRVMGAAFCLAVVSCSPPRHTQSPIHTTNVILKMAGLQHNAITREGGGRQFISRPKIICPG